MSNKDESEQVQFIECKLVNRRVDVIFYVNKDVVRLRTKRLASFKNREIVTTDNYFTKETFFALSHLLDILSEHSKEFRSFLDRAERNLIKEQDSSQVSSNIESLFNS